LLSKHNKFLAIIPARGGSKRLPRKNLLQLGGKPLIAWTIEAALRCPYIDEVMVTTDDSEIAEVSKKYGAKIPFLRPDELASDNATSFDAVKHAVDFYRAELGKEFDFIIMLQPTSPLRTSFNISEAIKQCAEKQASAIISVCEVDHSPLWMNTLPSDQSMSYFIREDVKNKRSQDLPKNYRLNGAIYICEVSRMLNEKTFFISQDIYAYIMSKETSIDIDDLFDFNLASYLISINTDEYSPIPF
jgi:CMP-N,N'-diacetyllegionaminic acid synthase